MLKVINPILQMKKYKQRNVRNLFNTELGFKPNLVSLKNSVS